MKRTMLGVGTVVLFVAGGCLASRDDSPKVDPSTQPVVEGSVIRVIAPSTSGVPAAVSVDIGIDAPFEVVLAYSVPVWCGDMIEAYADELDSLLPEGTLVTIERPAIAEGAGFGRLHQMVGGADVSAYGVDTVVLGEDTAAWEVYGAVEREDAVVYAAMPGKDARSVVGERAPRKASAQELANTIRPRVAASQGLPLPRLLLIGLPADWWVWG